MKYHRQQKDYTCGPACMKMVLSEMGRNISEKTLEKELKTSPKSGTGIRAFCRLARKMGMKAFSKKNSSIREMKSLLKDNFIIVCYYYKPEKTGHYAIVKRFSAEKIYLIDPWCGPNCSYSIEKFRKIWHSTPKAVMYKRWICAISRK